MTINNNYKLENKDWRHNMTKKYRIFNWKTLFLFLMIGIITVGFTACMKQQKSTFPMDEENEFNVRASQTGPLDPSGSLLTNIVWVTNVIQVTNERVDYITNRVIIPGKLIEETIYITNKGKVTTNYVYVDKISYVTEYVTNVVPDDTYVSRWHKSFMYRVYAPFAGIGAEGEWKYTNVSYLDTPTLSALWKKIVKMESHSGKEFIIRNRQRKDNGWFFFFDKNANLYWNKYPNKVLKEFVQGVIIQHRCGNDTKGAYAIAGLYKLTTHSLELSKWGDDGVNLFQGYNFVRTRMPGEYDIVVLNPGHVVNGSEYGFEIYNSTINGFRYIGQGNGYYEQRPETIMSKITHVSELWKNWRPWELWDLAFQINSSSIVPKK